MYYPFPRVNNLNWNLTNLKNWHATSETASTTLHYPMFHPQNHFFKKYHKVWGRLKTHFHYFLRFLRTRILSGTVAQTFSLSNPKAEAGRYLNFQVSLVNIGFQASQGLHSKTLSHRYGEGHRKRGRWGRQGERWKWGSGEGVRSCWETINILGVSRQPSRLYNRV